MVFVDPSKMGARRHLHRLASQPGLCPLGVDPPGAQVSSRFDPPIHGSTLDADPSISLALACQVHVHVGLTRNVPRLSLRSCSATIRVWHVVHGLVALPREGPW